MEAENTGQLQGVSRVARKDEGQEVLEGHVGFCLFTLGLHPTEADVIVYCCRLWQEATLPKALTH